MKNLFYILILILIIAPSALAGEADVIAVKIQQDGEHTYSFQVTVKHEDSGWQHYADRWDVLDENGTVLGTRVLYHPHVDEQPFTRSLSGVKIPASISRIEVRAHDSVHEYGGATVSVELP